MRRCNLMLMLFFTMTSCDKEEVLENDLIEMDLKGRVKTISEFHYLVNGDAEGYEVVGFINSFSSNRILNFNRDGYLEEEIFFNSDSIEDGKTIVTYHNDNLKSEIKTLDNTGNLAEREILEYDNLENLIKRMIYAPNGSPKYKYTYQYSGKNKEEECRFDSNNILDRRTTFNYDAKDNLIQKIESFSYGQIVYKTDYELDEKGQIRKEREFEGDNIVGFTTYEYNEFGRPVEVKRYNSSDVLVMQSNRNYIDNMIKENITKDTRGGIFEINNSITKYDNNENHIEIVNYDLSWTSIKVVKEFIYNYDDKNNWTDRLILKNKKASELVRRHIEYF